MFRIINRTFVKYSFCVYDLTMVGAWVVLLNYPVQSVNCVYHFYIIIEHINRWRIRKYIYLNLMVIQGVCLHLEVYRMMCTSVLLQPNKPKKGKKKVAAAPLAAKKVEPKKVVNPLFEKRPKNFGIGTLACY